MSITTKKFLRYTLLPEFLPRLRNMLTTGFGHISFFIAQIYGGVRLLPPHHPYLNPQNMGKFGIRHVVTEAARHLRFNKEHIDQIIIFFIIVFGLGLIFVQFGMLALAIFMPLAHAAAAGGGPMPQNFAQFFITPDAYNDIAYILLDRVFGVPGIFEDSSGFGSCVAASQPCFNTINTGNPAVTLNPNAALEDVWPWAVHDGLHAMFQLYSSGILVIAMIVFLYFVVTVAVETAESGQPFGRRFNHVWAPIRMVVAFGLLIPVANGMNAAQYVTLYAAKYGSGFATNGWNMFLGKALAGGNTPLGARSSMVATPNTPDPTSLLEYATVLQTCWWAENVINDRRVCGWMVDRSDSSTGGRQVLTPNTTYQDALNYYKNNDILIRFGEYRRSCTNYTTGVDAQGNVFVQCITQPVPSATMFQKSGATPGACQAGYPEEDADHPPAYSRHNGYVAPICGEVVMKTVAFQTSGTTPIKTDPGGYKIQELYFNILKDLWFGNLGGGCGTAGSIDSWGINIARKTAIPDNPNAISQWMSGSPNAVVPTAADAACLIAEVRSRISTAIAQGVTDEIADANIWAYGDLAELGWGGAAVWYNKIAQTNGALIAAAHSLPYVKSYPSVMEEVRENRVKNDNSVAGRDRYRPVQANGMAVQLTLPADEKIAQAEWAAYDMWRDMYPKAADDPSVFASAIYALFGLEGLNNLLKNTNVHPLAQLVAIGKSLVESAIQNLGYYMIATGGSVLGMNTAIGSFAGMASSFLFQVAMIGLGVGFVLFYVIPFLPFVYFFFAVGDWIKGIFEAMVGVPLWALAHIRIDGHGLPGDAAMNGYYMIFEVFLRPIMIVFGMVASIIIFAAQVFILHEIFPLVTSNLTGFEDSTASLANVGTTGSIEFKRGGIDQFFFTIVYAIVVYMQATASFKMIDLIPNQILRWMGANVQTFGDLSGDAAENLVRNITVGEHFVTQSLSSVDSGIKGVSGGLAGAISGKSKA